MFPVIHIDKLAEEIGVKRRWIIDNWIEKEELRTNGIGPAPHFRDGDQWFFPVGELEQWAKRRALASGSISIQTDQSD